MSAAHDFYRPRFARVCGAVLRVFTRIWFRYTIRRVARIPEGNVLFVGNQSGGGIVDVLCLIGAWSTIGPRRRRGVGMMSPQLLRMPILGRVLRAVGAIEADRLLAESALAKGHDVGVFPGGELDACRPVTEARSVYFGWRRGYVQLALRAGVPIVPCATIGSHYTYVLLPGSAALSRVTGMKRWARLERFPVVLGQVVALVFVGLAVASVVPWWTVLVAIVLAIVPNPVRVTTEVLPPIDVCAATAHIVDPDARVEAAHQLVHGALVRAVRRMRHRDDHARFAALDSLRD